MAITIEKLIEENVCNIYEWDHCVDDITIDKITNNYFLAMLEVRDEDNINVGVTVSDKEEITEIEELSAPFSFHPDGSIKKMHVGNRKIKMGLKQTITQWLASTKNTKIAGFVLKYCEDDNINPNSFYLKEWEDDKECGIARWRFISPCESWGLEVGLHTQPTEYHKATDPQHICRF